jgi:hypothetical protein
MHRRHARRLPRARDRRRTRRCPSPFAACLTGKLDCKGKTTVVVLSGGNVDSELHARVLREEI